MKWEITDDFFFYQILMAGRYLVESLFSVLIGHSKNPEHFIDSLIEIFSPGNGTIEQKHRSCYHNRTALYSFVTFRPHC